ncbi:hypothetical protein BJ998_007365 [Kutzneria kofuensis]|uniref:Uncharacterized protein n=1 Tax=Kutzneria kofuensis TaxID=103725 RepID=A0A7W9NKX6_9PSEU|nr:hypothetical protein [Kutzneria kofuensis]MBB5896169.1 hypothetical protein [Kutzneria kofuensis]
MPTFLTRSRLPCGTSDQTCSASSPDGICVIEPPSVSASPDRALTIR